MRTGFVIGDRGLGTAGDTHPAWTMSYAMAGPYLAVGASAIGQLHLARGLPRDDAFIIRSIGPWLAVAVADGVGSRPLSRYGATYVAEALTTMLLRSFVPLPKATRIEPRTELLPSDPRRLAPPSRVEEEKLEPSIARTTELLKWTKKASGGEPPSHDEILTSTLQQAASVGWWLAAMPGEFGLDEAPKPLQSPSQTATQSQETADTTQPPLDEPNLITIVREAFVNTHLGLREHARGLKVELADLSCTALALLLNLETGHGAVGQVGDGALLGLTAHGEVRELVQTPETENPQETYTLNRPDFQHYLAIAIVEQAQADPYVAFFVMTDGLSNDLLYSPPPALKDWAQKVNHNLLLSATPAQAAAGMLNWLATYQVPGSWDDRTLVVITRAERNYGNRPTAARQSQPTGSTEYQ